MKPKILYRTRLGRPTSIPTIFGKYESASYIPQLQDARESVESIFAARKSASGGPLTVAERVGEFIARNKPNLNIDTSAIASIASKLKVPGLALLGVAFVAGVSYLAYKLYRKWSDSNAEAAINKIMEDLKSTAPDLFKIPGWADQVRNEVIEAVSSGNDVAMTEKILQIKTAVVEKQNSMGKPVGAGIDLFYDKQSPRYTKRERSYMPNLYHGRGLVSPIR